MREQTSYEIAPVTVSAHVCVLLKDNQHFVTQSLMLHSLYPVTSFSSDAFLKLLLTTPFFKGGNISPTKNPIRI